MIAGIFTKSGGVLVVKKQDCLNIPLVPAPVMNGAVPVTRRYGKTPSW